MEWERSESARLMEAARDYIGQDLTAYCAKNFPLERAREECEGALKGKRAFVFQLNFCRRLWEKFPDSDSVRLSCMRMMANKIFSWQDMRSAYGQESPESALGYLKYSEYADIPHNDKGSAAVVFNCVKKNLFFELRFAEDADSGKKTLYQRNIAAGEHIKLIDMRHSVEFIIPTDMKAIRYDMPPNGLFVIKWAEETGRFELFSEQGNIICDAAEALIAAAQSP